MGEILQLDMSTTHMLQNSVAHNCFNSWFAVADYIRINTHLHNDTMYIYKMKSCCVFAAKLFRWNIYEMERSSL